MKRSPSASLSAIGRGAPDQRPLPQPAGQQAVERVRRPADGEHIAAPPSPCRRSAGRAKYGIRRREPTVRAVGDVDQAGGVEAFLAGGGTIVSLSDSASVTPGSPPRLRGDPQRPFLRGRPGRQTSCCSSGDGRPSRETKQLPEDRGHRSDVALHRLGRIRRDVKERSASPIPSRPRNAVAARPEGRVR